jgi:RNA polymerase sigma-70 factor (ECF subfamily)
MFLLSCPRAATARQHASGTDASRSPISRRLLSRDREPLFRTANDAPVEEVVQGVFLRLWADPSRFDAGRGSMRSFLLTQVHCRAVDVLRAESARREREQREAFRRPRIHDDLGREVVRHTTCEAVRHSLTVLARCEREAIQLAYFGGRTYKEVALLLRQPEGTVKSRIRSGLQRMRTALVEVGVGE